MKLLHSIVALGFSDVPQFDNREVELDAYEIVLASDDDKKIFAIDGIKGEKIWEKEIRDNPTHWPFLSLNYRVYFSDDSQTVRALNLQTGREMWSLDMDDHIAPAIHLSKDEDTLFVPMVNGQIVAYDVTQKDNVEKKWTYEAPGELESPMIDDLKNSMIYFCSGLDNMNYKGDLEAELGEDLSSVLCLGVNYQGEEVWRVPFDDALSSPPVMYDGRVHFLGFLDGQIISVDAKTGENKTLRDLPDISDGYPALDAHNGFLYAGHADGGIFSANLDESDQGKNFGVEWEDELEKEQAFSSILHCEGENDEMKAINFMVFASETDLIKYDVEEKEVVWKIPIPAASSMTSPVMDAWWRLIISTEEGHVLAVNTENGEIIWQSKVASDNLYGIVLHEDNVDPRCQSSSLHVMDEEVLLSRLMDGFDDIESLDDEKTADHVSEEDEEEIDADENVREEL